MAQEADHPSVIVMREQRRGPDGKWYYTPMNEVSDYLSATTAASARAYDTPTGKKFKLRTIIAQNLGNTTTTMRLTDSSGVTYTVFRIRLDPYAMVHIEGIEGIVFTNDVYMSLTSYVTGFNLTVAGELDPIEPAR